MSTASSFAARAGTPFLPWPSCSRASSASHGQACSEGGLASKSDRARMQILNRRWPSPDRNLDTAASAPLQWRVSMSSCKSKGGGADVLQLLLDRALLLDLEVSHSGKILKLGAVLGPQRLARSGNVAFGVACGELTRLAAGAACVLGHNLVRHDLPILRERARDLLLLRLPVIDTLVLSPICFPENPYHRLVKNYKLVRESINDPVADARQAATLFKDEFQALNGLRQTEPRLFEVLHFLLATPDLEADPLSNGMALVFRALGAHTANERTNARLVPRTRSLSGAAPACQWMKAWCRLKPPGWRWPTRWPGCGWPARTRCCRRGSAWSTR